METTSQSWPDETRLIRTLFGCVWCGWMEEGQELCVRVWVSLGEPQHWRIGSRIVSWLQPCAENWWSGKGKTSGETRSRTYGRQWQTGICFISQILWKVVKVPLNGLNVLEFNNNMMINGSIKEISLLTDSLDKIFCKFLGILHQLQRTRCDNNWMLKQKKVNDDDL